jgi:hypothetical protein
VYSAVSSPVRRWKFDVGSSTLEVRRWKFDVGSSTLKVRRWKFDVRANGPLSSFFFLLCLASHPGCERPLIRVIRAIRGPLFPLSALLPPRPHPRKSTSSAVKIPAPESQSSPNNSRKFAQFADNPPPPVLFISPFCPHLNLFRISPVFLRVCRVPAVSLREVRRWKFAQIRGQPISAFSVLPSPFSFPSVNQTFLLQSLRFRRIIA